MDAQRLELEVRVATLERRLARRTATLVAVSAVLAGCAALSAMRPNDDVLRAKRIELVDRTGNVRVLLAAELDGPRTAGIDIHGAEDASQVSIRAGMLGMGKEAQPMCLLDLTSTSKGAEHFGSAKLCASTSFAGVQVDCDDSRHVAIGATSSSTNLELGADRPVSRDTANGSESTFEPMPWITLSEKDGAAGIRVQDAKGATLFKAP